MSADNFLFIRKDHGIEERYETYPDEPGDVIHHAETEDLAIDWAIEYMKKYFVEYGIVYE